MKKLSIEKNVYSASDVAKYIIDWCNEHKSPIINLKLQKMLYFVQAEFISKLGRPCFTDLMEAWDYGPVVPEVYSEYRKFGRSDIPVFFDTSRLTDLFSREDKGIADEIIDRTSKIDALDLVNISHQQSPWIDAYNNPDDHTITVQSMMNFFGNRD